MDLIDQVSSLDFTLENFTCIIFYFLAIKNEFIIVGTGC